MKIAIVQFDNRPIETLGLLAPLLELNQSYAARHGYSYEFINAQTVDLPCYWIKPLLVAERLEAGYDAVVWMDTDAVFHDRERGIEPLLQGGEAMLAAGDNPIWTSPFNAGVFFVQGRAGLELMRRWSDLFAGTSWRRTPDAWVCESQWAGPCFEQGAFIKHLLDEVLATGAFRMLDWKVLQSPFPVEGTFTLHFAGPFRRNLPAYLTWVMN